MNATVAALKGSFVATVRDADTLEIKREYEHDNDITLGGYWTSFIGGNDLLNTGSIAFGRIFVSTSSLPENVKAFHRIAQLAGEDLEDSETSAWEIVDDDPIYVQRTGRFNSPASTRNINLIGLSGTGFEAGTIATLTTPCVQNPGEVLDITYRIQVFNQTNNGGDLPLASDYARGILQHLVSTNGENGAFPRHTSFYGGKVPPVGGIDYGTAVYPGFAFGGEKSKIVFDHYKKEFALDLTTSEKIGTVIRSLGYGYPDGRYFNEADGRGRDMVWAPFLRDDSPYKPIQTVHNHSVDAVEWGLDVDFLATGQGSITLDGSSWVQSNWPEFWRIDYHKTGNVGVSSYAFRTRKLLGFEGNTYAATIDFTAASKWQDEEFPDRKTVNEAHGLRAYAEIVEYDVQTFIHWDIDGLTFTNFNDNDTTLTFDANSTPPLAVTNLAQVAVDDNGDVWVACRNTGLYKITDPQGSPSITLMNSGTNGLPGSNNAYGVEVGTAGRMWAIVDGGLVYTDTPGAATVSFTAATFTYTGISDSNWDKVRFIRIDRASPDNQMGIVAYDGSNRDLVVWYSDNIPATTGPNSTAANLDWGRLTVSRQGHVWLQAHNSTDLSTGSAHRRIFGSATVGEDFTGMAALWSYMYDYYGVPYVGGDLNNDISYRGQTRATNRSPATNVAVDRMAAGYYGTPRTFETDGGDVALYVRHPNVFANEYQCDFLTQPVPPATGAFASGGDSLNAQHSPFEETLWTKYHWNGSAWEANYYVDAADTASFASGPYPAARHNFDTESHYFTGRSMIDASAAFTPSNFSTTATVAMKINSQAAKQTATAYPEQETHQCLFSVWDETNEHLVSVYLNTSNVNEFRVFETIGDNNRTVHTIGTSPTKDVDHRVVVTFNGSAVNVYVDGTQVGTTITLDRAVDWSTAGIDAYIGCTVYPDVWNTNYVTQRITPQPSSFFRGTMQNVQFWNTTWSQTDVTNDNGNPDGVISSQPAANLVARYELTQSLEGTETKLTHTAAEELKDTVTIAFVDGASGDAFVATDYHTFGLVDGILKDNAISFDQRFSLYFKPVDFEFSDFNNGANTNTIDGTNGQQITEPAKFVRVLSNTSSSGNQIDPLTLSGSGTVPGLPTVVASPGQLAQNTNTGSGPHSNPTTNPHGALIGQPITADGYVEFRAGLVPHDTDVIFGLSDTNLDLGHVYDNGSFTHAVRVEFNGDVDILENASFTSPTITTVDTITVDDRLRIRRVGTTVTYEKIDINDVVTTLHTSTKASSGTVYGRASFYEYNFITDVVVNYTLPPNVMLIGDSNTLTGVWDEDFLRIDTNVPETLEIAIDGTPAVVSVSDTYFTGMTTPSPGEVTVNGILGWLLFNNADAGSTVSGTVIAIFNKV